MDRAEYLDLLASLDDQTHWEFPEGFLYRPAERRFLAMAEDVEKALGEKCTIEYHSAIQDASFHAQLFVPKICTQQGYNVKLRTSNFGNLATLYDVGEDVKPACADKIIDVLKQHEYIYIPSWVLREPYNGTKTIGIPNWGVRYFDWL